MLVNFRNAIIVLSLVFSSMQAGIKMRNPLLDAHWRIVGGQAHEDTMELAYMVSIQLCNIHPSYGMCPEKNQRHECGGGLLSKYFVITACHCVADVPLGGSGLAQPAQMKIRYFSFVAGTSHLRKRGPHTQVRFANKLSFHPRCATIEGSVLYDLGLAEMSHPFDFNEYVRPLAFYKHDVELERKVKEMESFNASRKSTSETSRCIVAGWGDVRPGQHDPAAASDALNSVTMYVVPEAHCLKAYQKRDNMYDGFSFHQYAQICAVGRYGNESDCVGDSGSPVIRDGYLIAVVSYGYECASDLPSVYQTVATLSNWYDTDIRPRIPREKCIFNRAGACSFADKLSMIPCLVICACEFLGLRE